MDTATFTELYETTYGKIFSYCYSRCMPDREEAADCAAETFERAFKHLDSLKSTGARGTRNWLFTIARNVVTSHYRRRGVEKQMVEDVGRITSEFDANGDPEHVALMHEDMSALFAALAELPDRQREAVYLKAVVGLSNHEIAGVMACSDVNARVIGWRGFKRVQDALRETV
jgi:RNA polymerase sigma factor (sigma-70 family)